MLVKELKKVSFDFCPLFNMAFHVSAAASFVVLLFSKGDLSWVLRNLSLSLLFPFWRLSVKSQFLFNPVAV